MVIFSERYLDSDSTNFNILYSCMAVWCIWSSLYNTDIKYQPFFLLSLNNVKQCFKVDTMIILVNLIDLKCQKQRNHHRNLIRFHCRKINALWCNFIWSVYLHVRLIYIFYLNVNQSTFWYNLSKNSLHWFVVLWMNLIKTILADIENSFL